MSHVLRDRLSIVLITGENSSDCVHLRTRITDLSRVMRKPTLWFLTWSNINQAVQLQKMARGLEFRI